MLINLDYAVAPKPRYNEEPHGLLFKILNASRQQYAYRLRAFSQLPDFDDVPREPDGSGGPYWLNDFFPPLDAIALTGMIADCRPALYMEIGSGNSTKFARRAVRRYSPSTRIVSIDPEPRAEVNDICDDVVRERMESVDLDIFRRLRAGDFLFIDSSHRCLMNSDVTATFLDVLPYLQLGVHVHFHDIFLPWDYPLEWTERYYSEQYLLACWLLAGQRMRVDLPNTFISLDKDLSTILDPVWAHVGAVQRAGCSFWVTLIGP